MTGIKEGILFGPDQQNLRWKNLKDDEPGAMFDTIGQEVFPFLRGLRGDGSTYSEHMKDARFTIPTASASASMSITSWASLSRGTYTRSLTRTTTSATFRPPAEPRQACCR
ncbi:hypothetical protein MPSYJ_23070 [Mycolicibacterium psychrotolerans]|uniref:Uncharacterized protein n=1 Tax=Mycolicibacterium psychrotolerans TaxID=216929 RepID=A0A7I7M9Y4_9MYCO|nr:hypothetical protein MPSYJ_23070 [Mycolicibacterium psychrotolerans]